MDTQTDGDIQGARPDGGTNPVEVRQRAAELELDVLVAHELASGGPAAAVLWAAGGYAVPDQVEVIRQAIRDDGRTTDVLARAGTDDDALALHCEDKAIGGEFEDGQPESYDRHVKRNGGAALLVAPRAFVDVAGRAWLGTTVLVEDLRDALQTAADAGEESELVRSYRWRAKALDQYCNAPGYTLMADPDTVSFTDAYRALAEEVSGGRVRLRPNTMQTRGGGWAYYDLAPFSSNDLYLTHKLAVGHLDLTATHWTLRQLRAWVGGLDENDKPPSGWQIAVPDKARPTKLTGERVPVLRWPVPIVEGSLVPFSEVTGEIRTAIEVAAQICSWLHAGAGSVLASVGETASVDAELRYAERAARLIGDDRADAIAALIDHAPPN